MELKGFPKALKCPQSLFGNFDELSDFSSLRERKGQVLLIVSPFLPAQRKAEASAQLLYM